MGPVDTGTLWAGFPIEDCTDPSGDPVVLYDQTTDHWILSQFTTRGLDDPSLPFYNCVAVSQTGDPTGAYYRYAFITQADDVDGGYFFPDYPKYGVWSNSYILTTRDFGLVDRYGISVYALEKNKMVNGEPNARAVQFFLEANVTPTGTVPLELVGDGLLPPDIDGNRRPIDDAPAPIVGTQDDAAGYGATFDALNIWELSIKWSAHPTASTNSRRHNCLLRRLTRSILVHQRPATACRSPESLTLRSTSTSSRTGSGRPGGSLTGTSARTSRW